MCRVSNKVLIFVFSAIVNHSVSSENVIQKVVLDKLWEVFGDENNYKFHYNDGHVLDVYCWGTMQKYGVITIPEDTSYEWKDKIITLDNHLPYRLTAILKSEHSGTIIMCSYADKKITIELSCDTGNNDFLTHTNGKVGDPDKYDGETSYLLSFDGWERHKTILSLYYNVGYTKQSINYYEFEANDEPFLTCHCPKSTLKYSKYDLELISVNSTSKCPVEGSEITCKDSIKLLDYNNTTISCIKSNKEGKLRVEKYKLFKRIEKSTPIPVIPTVDNSDNNDDKDTNDNNNGGDEDNTLDYLKVAGVATVALIIIVIMIIVMCRLSKRKLREPFDEGSYENFDSLPSPSITVTPPTIENTNPYADPKDLRSDDSVTYAVPYTSETNYAVVIPKSQRTNQKAQNQIEPTYSAIQHDNKRNNSVVNRDDPNYAEVRSYVNVTPGPSNTYTNVFKDSKYQNCGDPEYVEPAYCEKR